MTVFGGVPAVLCSTQLGQPADRTSACMALAPVATRPPPACYGLLRCAQTEDPSYVDTDASNDVQIFNYFLNLDYLLAEFYSCAATGQGLPAEVRGGGPASTGCQQATLTGAVAVRTLERNQDQALSLILALTLTSESYPGPGHPDWRPGCQLSLSLMHSDLLSAVAVATSHRSDGMR